MTGSFKSRDNAKQGVTFLYSKRIESFVDAVSISGSTWERVQVKVFQTGIMQKNVWKNSRQGFVMHLILLSQAAPDAESPS
nr:hypothetical protein [Bacillus sp. J33]